MTVLTIGTCFINFDTDMYKSKVLKMHTSYH